MTEAPPEDVLDSRRAGPLVIRGSAVRVLGYALGTALAVAATAVLLREIGVEAAGRYTTVVSLLAIVTGLTDAGLVNIAVREYSVRTGTARDEVVSDILGLRLALTTVGVGAAVAFAAAAGYSQAMVVGTALGGAGLVLTALYGTFATPLAAQLRVGTITGLELLRNALSSVLLATLAATGAGLVALLAVPLPVGAVLVVVAFWLVHGLMPWRPSFALGRWRAIIGEVLPYALATAVGFIYIYLTVILLGFVADDREVGLFGAAFRVFVVLAGASTLLAQTAFPVLARAARDDSERLAYASQRLMEGSFIVAAVAGLGTAFAAPVAIEVVAGDAFSESVDVLELQAIAFAGTFPAAIAGFALIAQARYRAVLVVNAAALVASFVVTLVLATAEGAAVANIAGELVLLGGYVVALVSGPKRIALRPGLLPRIGLAAGLGAAAGVLAPGPSLARTAVALAVFAAALIAVRGVPEEIRQALLRRI